MVAVVAGPLFQSGLLVRGLFDGFPLAALVIVKVGGGKNNDLGFLRMALGALDDYVGLALFAAGGGFVLVLHGFVGLGGGPLMKFPGGLLRLLGQELAADRAFLALGFDQSRLLAGRLFDGFLRTVRVVHPGVLAGSLDFFRVGGKWILAHRASGFLVENLPVLQAVAGVAFVGIAFLFLGRVACGGNGLWGVIRVRGVADEFFADTTGNRPLFLALGGAVRLFCDDVCGGAFRVAGSLNGRCGMHGFHVRDILLLFFGVRFQLLALVARFLGFAAVTDFIHDLYPIDLAGGGLRDVLAGVPARVVVGELRVVLRFRCNLSTFRTLLALRLSSAGTGGGHRGNGDQRMGVFVLFDNGQTLNRFPAQLTALSRLRAGFCTGGVHPFHL